MKKKKGLGFSRTEDRNFPFDVKLKEMHKIGIMAESWPSQATLWVSLLLGIPLYNKRKVNELIKTMRRADAEMYGCTACGNEFPFRRPPVACPICNAIDPFVLAQPLALIKLDKKCGIAA